MRGLGEQAGFEQWNSVETPGGVGEFLHELGFGGVFRAVLVTELAAVLFVSYEIFRWQDGGAAC